MVALLEQIGKYPPICVLVPSLLAGDPAKEKNKDIQMEKSLSKMGEHVVTNARDRIVQVVVKKTGKRIL